MGIDKVSGRYYIICSGKLLPINKKIYDFSPKSSQIKQFVQEVLKLQKKEAGPALSDICPKDRDPLYLKIFDRYIEVFKNDSKVGLDGSVFFNVDPLADGSKGKYDILINLCREEYQLKNLTEILSVKLQKVSEDTFLQTMEALIKREPTIHKKRYRYAALKKYAIGEIEKLQKSKVCENE